MVEKQHIEVALSNEQGTMEKRRAQAVAMYDAYLVRDEVEVVSASCGEEYRGNIYVNNSGEIVGVYHAGMKGDTRPPEDFSEIRWAKPAPIKFGEWVDASMRLPCAEVQGDDRELVLVCDSRGNIFTGYLGIWDSEYAPVWYQYGRDSYSVDDVMYWMPLPEQPGI